MLEGTILGMGKRQTKHRCTHADWLGAEENSSRYTCGGDLSAGFMSSYSAETLDGGECEGYTFVMFRVIIPSCSCYETCRNWVNKQMLRSKREATFSIPEIYPTCVVNILVVTMLNNKSMTRVFHTHLVNKIGKPMFCLVEWILWALIQLHELLALKLPSSTFDNI